MILRKVTLENVRSYKDETTVKIPPGRTLFQGDIGCGKSTILSAIEFALFGLGDIDGNYLLRSGEKRGSVSLEFEVKGRPYEIYRSLIKQNGKHVIQDKCYIIDGDIKTDYSVTEMKSRILEIININEKPQTKATSLIYRYAIFTPQEMMKQILIENHDRRLEILRRAFGIDEYSTAKKNTDLISKWIREENRISNEISKDLPEKRTILEERNNKANNLSHDIVKLRSIISELDERLKDLQKRVNELKKKKDLVIRLQTSIPYLKDAIAKNQRREELAQQTLEKLEVDITTINKSQEIVDKLRYKYEDYLEKKESLSHIEGSVRRYESLDKEKTRLEQSVENARKYLELEITKKKKEIEEEEKQIQEAKDSITDLQALEDDETDLKNMLKQLPSLRKESADILSRISKYNANIASKEELIAKGQKEIHGIYVIGEEATCPKCKQKLSKEHISKVKDEFESEKLRIEEEVNSIRKFILKEEQTSNEIDLQIATLERKEEELKNLQRRLGKLSEKRDVVEKATKELKEKKTKLYNDIKLLQEEKYALNERKKLSLLLIDLERLTNDKATYDEIYKVVSTYETEQIASVYIENLQEVKRKLKVENEISKANSTKAALIEEISSDERKLIHHQGVYDKHKDVMRHLDDLQSKIRDLQNNTSEKRQILAGKLSELQAIRSNLKELKLDVLRKEEYYRNKQIFQQMQNWLDQCFVPGIEDIEKYVLKNIQEEFNQLFQRWFNILMEIGDISVEVDESFTPIITQGGYSLGIDNLSGGEKTSTALAYRLALNTMIKKAAEMKNNLIIFDEPTDGFGKEQLIRLRRVLDELDCAQIIMVSHERELESFVDTIYRITKEGSVSRIELIT